MYSAFCPIDTPIMINHATADMLQQIPGISRELAEQIITNRMQGTFKSVEDLKQRIPNLDAVLHDELDEVFNFVDKSAPTSPKEVTIKRPFSIHADMPS